MRTWTSMWRSWTSRGSTVAKIGFIQFCMANVILFIGWGDLTSAFTLTGKLRGVFFLILGIMVIIGGLAGIPLYQRGSPVAGRVALIGSALGLFIAIWLLYLQLRSPLRGYTYPRRLIAWAVLVVVCLWSVQRLVRGGASIVSMPRFGKLLSAISIPTIIAAASFFNASIYQPSIAPQVAELTVGFGKAVSDAQKTAAAIPVTIKLKNPSSVRMYVLASAFSVTARKINRKSDGSSRESIRLSAANGNPIMRHAKVKSYELLHADTILTGGLYLEPNGETTTSRVVQLPIKNLSDFDTLRLQATALVVRGDRLTPALYYGTTSWSTGSEDIPSPLWMDPKTDFLYWSFSVNEGNAIRELMEGPQYFHVWWVLEAPNLHNPAGPYLAGTDEIRDEDAPIRPASDYEAMARRYGLQRSTAFTELPIWEINKSLKP